MRTTVRLPEDLLERAKHKASREGTTLTALIERGLRLVLQRKPEAPRSRSRPRPRLSSVTGRPLIDITKTAGVLDALDDRLPIEKRR